jgi:hypothetical protein
MSFASWILWREVKSQHLWVLSAKYGGSTTWMWPDAPRLFLQEFLKPREEIKESTQSRRVFQYECSPTIYTWPFTPTTIAHPTFNSSWQEFHDHIFSEPVHSFCLELMPDFPPTSEVTSLLFSSGQTSLLLTMILTIPCRTQCLPLKPGQSFIMQYIQSPLWDLNLQLWLNWWPGMPQWTQFRSVPQLTREKAYLWLHLQLPRRKEPLRKSLLR